VVPVADVLGVLVPELQGVVADRAAGAAASSAKARAALQRFAADPQALKRLLRMPAPRAIAQVLAMMQVFDKAPRRREGLAVQVGKVLGVAQVLALACDVVLARPRSVGAVLLQRLKRALAGNVEPLSRCRADWPIGRFIAAIADLDDLDENAPAVRDGAGRRDGGTASAPPTPGAPGPDALRATGSFADLLRSRGLGDLIARRATA
jgi:hypothetical protein